MTACEYQCMECKMDFTLNFSEREREQTPIITCPHCGAEHVHTVAAECK